MKDQLSFDIGPDLQALKKYTKMKMNLAAIIRHLHQSLINSKLNDATEQVNELSVKLAEDHFVLATLGQFKRGKSSLMNAILGRNLLPTGILPLTSAITTIKYGPIEKLILSQDNSIFQKELPIEDIVYYVTEKENPSNIKQVKTASIELPLQFLRRGVEFVDTPGVGSAITANTDTTYTFLPQCDAAIFVTSADNPLTSTELDFLHKISRYVEKIFFVVNKIDLLQADEVTQVLAFSKQIISKELNQSDITLFPLSAQIGLNAKTELDTVAYEKSGLKALEEELADFLAKEKGQIFLLKILRQVIKLADENKQMSKELLQFAQMFSDALAIPKRLEEPFEKIVYSTSSPADIYAFSKPSIFQDFHTRGCPACQYIVKATFDFFAHYQYKLSIQKDMQEQLAEYGGVCPFHTWQLNGISSAYGFSLGYMSVW